MLYFITCGVGYILYYHTWSVLYIVISHVECYILYYHMWSVLYIVLSHVEYVIYCIHVALDGALRRCQSMLIPITDGPREKQNCGLIG